MFYITSPFRRSALPWRKHFSSSVRSARSRSPLGFSTNASPRPNSSAPPYSSAVHSWPCAPNQSPLPRPQKISSASIFVRPAARIQCIRSSRQTKWRNRDSRYCFSNHRAKRNLNQRNNGHRGNTHFSRVGARILVVARSKTPRSRQFGRPDLKRLPCNYLQNLADVVLQARDQLTVLLAAGFDKHH